MSETSGIKFRPVMGTEDFIKKTVQSNGWLYVATDSGNMYLDVDNRRISIGGAGGSGSSSFSWANGDDTTIVKAHEEEEDTTYIIDVSCIENGVTPRADTLILNSDGRFFRVSSEEAPEEGKIIANLIAVSGSGGGGGGTVVERDVSIEWDERTIKPGMTYVYGQSFDALFTPTTTAPGDTECVVTFTIVNEETGETLDPITQTGRSGNKMKFDIANLPKSSNITLKINVTSYNSEYNHGEGWDRTIKNLRTVKMEITKPNADQYLALIKPNDVTGRLALSYMPHGEKAANGSAIVEETLHVYVDEVELPTLRQVVDPSFYDRIVTVQVPRQSHGVHKIEMKLSATVGGSVVYTDPIEYEGAWATEADDTPIIWIGKYDNVVVNYENSYIYYMVYDPASYESNLPAEIHLLKENVEVAQINTKYSDDGWLVWDISNIYTLGDNNFTIRCRTTTVNISIRVTNEGSRRLGLIEEESLLVNMTTAGRSSAEISSQRNVFKSSVNENAITASMIDFNWQNNGWKDSQGPDSRNGVDSGSYLSIANDAKLNIALSSGLNLNYDKDYTFEFRFRVSNVQEYSTLIKTIPKYFYDIPVYDTDNETIIGWEPTYTIISTDEETTVTPHAGYTSLYENEIIERGYKIGVDKYGNLLMDEVNTIKTADTSSGVVVKWMNQEGYGLCIGTQEAFFRTPTGITNVRYCEDEVINLTFVASKKDALCYVYLNGILSGAIGMPTGTGSNFTIDEPFEFNSNYCDFDLYRFRIYEIGLTMPNVIHNYLSDMHSIKLYDQNQLTDPLDPTALSFEALVTYNQEHPDDVSMPYCVWQIRDSGSDELLPWKKGNARKCDMEFVNPSADRELEIWNEEKYDMTDPNNPKRLGISPYQYYLHSPSYKAQGANIDVQGTSSQKYPRRNYKTKLKDAKDTWVYTKGPLANKPLTSDYYFSKSTEEYLPDVNKDSYDKNTMYKLSKKFHQDANYGVNKFTWKIDYMESSGSYNTGFANLMGNIGHPLYSKHPLDDLNLGIDTSNLRTSVYGFPVLVFHKYANGKYEYIGRYNKNLDKSANEAYGFEDETLHPYVPQRTRKVLNENNEYVDEVYQPTIAEIAECWEMEDNQGYWCSFRYPGAAARSTRFGTLQEGTSGDGAKLEILNHYEYRYSFYADELDAAYEYAAFTDANTQVEYSNNGQINTYVREKHANLEKLFDWCDSCDTSNPTNENLKDSNNNDTTVTYLVSSKLATTDPDYDSVDYEFISEGLWNATFHKDTKEYRRQKFRAEFSDHFDKEYCLTYFVLTELLLCYDSRGKNLMMASFGPTRTGGEYIWYPMFYDVDTQLGLNNSGAYLWDYDADVTEKNLFSTPTSVLWNNLYDVFYDDIVQKYRVLRGISNPATDADRKLNGSLTEKNIVGAYECDPKVFDSYAMRGVRPIIAIGLDEYYKYLAPALSAQDFANGKIYAGYYDTTGAHKYQTSGPTYIYTCQGDKKLTTELLVRNRLNYLDSQWRAGNYTAGVVENEIFLRANANLRTSSDKFLETAVVDGFTTTNEFPVDYFDARPGAKVKPYLHQYVSYFHDGQASVPVKYDGSQGQEDGVWTNVDAGKLEGYKNQPDFSQQITYFPGGDYISSLGDLSLMYPNALQFFHAKRMLDFRLGSDIPGYSNPGMNPPAVECELSDMPLLKFVNLSRLSQFQQEMFFTSSEKLQEFRAVGSIIERVNFAPGAPLHTVHLPSSMTTISLIQHKNLNKILTNPDAATVVRMNDVTHKYEYLPAESYRGLYIEGVTDYNPVTQAHTGHKLTNLEIEGGGLGYHSYTILKNLYDLKINAQNNKFLRASLVDVEWTPYQLVEVGTIWNNTQQYYLFNDHSTFEDYVYTNADNWFNDLLNERVYIYNPDYTKFDPNDASTADAEERTITDLTLLDNFIDQFKLGNTQFGNTSGANTVTIPTITGTLYVSNGDGEPIDEADLTDVYKKYFKNLTIQVANINPANLTKYVRIYENGKTEILDIERTSGTAPMLPNRDNTEPTLTNYDFAGWSLDNPNEVDEPVLALRFDPTQTDKDRKYIVEDPWNELTFNENVNVITLYAIFTPTVYQMQFVYEDDTPICPPIGTPFGSPINIPTVVPYQDEGDLPLTEKYAFLGYALSPDALAPLDMSRVSANQERKFYALFERTSVYENPISDEYLYFQPIDVSLGEDSGITQTVHGLAIGLKSNYYIRGKVTLPTSHADPNNPSATLPVLAFIGSTNNGFARNGTKQQNTNDITCIFWDRSGSVAPSLLTTGADAFNSGIYNYIELPPTCVHIGGQAFYGVTILGYNGANGIDLSNIRVIEGSGFNSANIVTDELKLTSIRTLNARSFAYLVHSFNIKFGSETQDCLLTTLSNTLTITKAGENSDPVNATVYGSTGVSEEIISRLRTFIESNCGGTLTLL